MKEKVVREFYRLVVHSGIKSEIVLKNAMYSIDLYWEAFRIAGEMKKQISVQRITVTLHTVKDFMDLLFYPDKKEGDVVERENVTGSYSVVPPHFAQDQMSRYNPVNGWVIPEEIEVE